MTVTRFPPSPTGYLHIGGARTALYSWLYARQHQGKFVLRIEDTDLERSTPESVQAILDGMQWLGLDYDAGPFYQTQRFDRYKEVVTQLLDSGHAYHCECSTQRLNEMREQQKSLGKKAKYDRRCRDLNLPAAANTTVRFKNPVDGDVVIEDIVKGNIVISNHELDDLVIARSSGVPTYNLTVVVDDMDMDITHVIRGDDHINNTPRQINILRALGATLPCYAHVPMILGEDGARLSKRHGAVGVMQYRDDGYLPEALLSYLARLGWSHGDQELFTIDEMLELFKLQNVSRSPSAFNVEKCLWVNQEFIKAMSAETLLEKAGWHFANAEITIGDTGVATAIVDLVKDRCKTLCEVVEQSRFFFTDVTGYNEKQVAKHIKGNTGDVLSSLIEKLDELEDWSAAAIHKILQIVVDDFAIGFGQVAQPVRIAVTGSASSPAIDQTLALLGKQQTLDRLRQAVPFFNRKYDNS